MTTDYNIELLKTVAKALAALETKTVFVGGAVVSLYADKPVTDFRPTDDIDVVVEVISYAERAGFEEKIRALGFMPDIDSKIVCRYKLQDITVDIMPTNDPSIGFTNIWYAGGFNHTRLYELDEKISINILQAPYFIATKMEAFKGRGDSDGRFSQDFEDIVFILENRDSVWSEISATEIDLKKYLQFEFTKLLSSPYFFEWVDGHVQRLSPPASYYIVEQLEQFIAQ